MKKSQIQNDGTRFEDSFGTFALSRLPGCGNVGISHGVYVTHHHQGKGIGQAQHKERLKEAYALGMRFLLCTVNPENEVEKHILAKMGWHKITEFYWCPTGGHKVEMWGRQLGPDVTWDVGHTATDPKDPLETINPA